jgi:hypothetical protein
MSSTWGLEYTFPVLEIDAIDNFFKEMADITITEDDLKKPQVTLIAENH